MTFFQRTPAAGVATAVVTENRDPQGLCRVQLRYPWHERPQEGYWARLAVPMAGAARGMVLIPEVGEEVLVGFERGDLRYPYVLGALWNGKERPPVTNDDGRNDKRVLVSRKKHSLSFDDGDPGVVELAHENGALLRLSDDDIVLRDKQGNRVKIDNSTGAVSIESSGALEIRAAAITIEASGALTLKAGATLTVRGAMVNIN